MILLVVIRLWVISLSSMPYRIHIMQVIHKPNYKMVTKQPNSFNSQTHKMIMNRITVVLVVDIVFSDCYISVCIVS